MDLFSTKKTILNLPDGKITYIPNFLKLTHSNTLFKSLKNNINWQLDDITLFGKTYKQPRLTAWYNDIKKTYTYSNITMQPNPLTKDLLHVKKTIENTSGFHFNAILLNLYRNGNDSNGWHADNEKELGEKPIIASLSLGEERIFQFKHREIKTQKHKLLLENGSLLIMAGNMQQKWLHQIPKTKKQVGERINLTFRKIY